MPTSTATLPSTLTITAMPSAISANTAGKRSDSTPNRNRPGICAAPMTPTANAAKPAPWPRSSRNGIPCTIIANAREAELALHRHEEDREGVVQDAPGDGLRHRQAATMAHPRDGRALTMARERTRR